MIERLKRASLTLLILFAFAPPLSAHAAGSWPWPVDGDVITPYKNGSDPYAAGQHRGIDIASPVGTAVHSSVAGSVTYAGHLPDGGITATVRSEDGGYLVSYLHMSELAVSRGDSVSAGSTVGSVGLTGKRSASQPHLHLSVRLANSGAYVDPLPLLGPHAIAKPPASETPAAAKPVQNAAPHAKAQTDARANARARSPRHSAIEHRVRRPAHVESHGTNPHIVHAPAKGDSVSAGHSNQAADSARESHASNKGSGRVAPPPLGAEPPKHVTLASPGRDAASLDSAPPAQTAQPTSGPPYVTALLFLIVASALALAIRRRRSGGQSGFTPPLADRGDLSIRPSDERAEVVELRAMHRRA